MKTLKSILIMLFMTSSFAIAQPLQVLDVCFGKMPDTTIINDDPTVRSWLDGWYSNNPSAVASGEQRYITWQYVNQTDLIPYYARAMYNQDSLKWLVSYEGIRIWPLDTILNYDTVLLVNYLLDTTVREMVPTDTVMFLLKTYKPVICLATTVSNQRNEILFDVNDIALGDTIDVFRDNSAIGTLVYDNTVTDLIYVDSSLNQNITKKYKYTASIRGTCRESWINTIYLRYSGGNLVWNDYELDQDEGVIEGYSVYKISNGITDSIYRMERGIDDINGIYEFTDLAYVPGDTYFVTAVKTDGCATSKTTNGVISSNKVTVGTVGIEETNIKEQTLLVLGQHQGKLVVKSDQQDKDIKVFNLSGQMVGQKLSKGAIAFNIPAGIYFVTDGITTIKAVVY